jgi:D-alanyl-D-alanine carboxypeptidase/D-alanyl-D-alanine-endopeptidase (penicillin-binding protein 4)
VDLTATPTRPGDLVVVSVRPENPRIEIRNNCRTGQGEPVLRNVFGSFEYRLEGRTAKQWPFGAVAFPDPGLLFAESLRTHLAKTGVRVIGEVSRERIRLPDGAIPAGLTIIETHRTSLADCLARAGKNSQNLFAECLLKRAGYAMASKSGMTPAVGSWESGAAAVQRIAGTAGIDSAGLKVADGSGLSRDNTCTARQLAAILAWSNGQPFKQVLHDSLAEAGVDGSLRKRLKNLDGRIHAKTGTMRGIRTLAGYVDADSGPRYAFAIMFNNYKGGSGPYKEIQDRFCRVLAEFSEPRP